MPAKKRKAQHRKVRAKPKLYAGKTENEWRNWGAEFGKQIDRGSRNFSEGMEKMGEDLQRHAERNKMRDLRCRMFESLGMMGPLIKSIVSIIFLAILIILLSIVGSLSLNAFIAMLSGFLSANIPWIFLASLLFGYARYLSSKKGYWLVFPIVISLKIIFVLWILLSILYISGTYTGSTTIKGFASFALVTLPALFSIFLVIGYILDIAKMMLVRVYKK